MCMWFDCVNVFWLLRPWDYNTGDIILLLQKILILSNNQNNNNNKKK